MIIRPTNINFTFRNTVSTIFNYVQLKNNTKYKKTKQNIMPSSKYIFVHVYQFHKIPMGHRLYILYVERKHKSYRKKWPCLCYHAFISKHYTYH